MDADPSLGTFHIALGVLLVDLLLSGDNAIVIALACRALDARHRVRALWLGILGAVLARLLLTSTVSLALSLPLLKLVGGLLLLKISVSLIVDNVEHAARHAHPEVSTVRDIASAVKTIVLADLVMSLDNVLALSAVTQGNFGMLLLGLLLSMPILMFGSLYISRLIDLYPMLLWVGGAILGAVAGALMLEDPVFGGTFSGANSVMNLVIPWLAAAYVVVQARIMVRNAQTLRDAPQPDTLWAIFSGPPAVHAPVEEAPVLAIARPTTREAASDQQVPQAKVAVAPPAATPAPTAPTVRGEALEPPAPGWVSNGRNLIAVLATLVVLAGIGIVFLVDSPLTPLPDGFINYQCKTPPSSIAYRPGGKKLRVQAEKGMATARVEGNSIIWEDYRIAALGLGIPPPITIVSADTHTLVVTGGMFENATCAVNPPTP